jgi:hypothetical protein
MILYLTSFYLISNSLLCKVDGTVKGFDLEVLTSHHGSGIRDEHWWRWSFAVGMLLVV